MKNTTLSRIFAVLLPLLIIFGIIYLVQGDEKSVVKNTTTTCEHILLERMSVLETSYDVDEVYEGPITKVNFDGNFPEARMFRTKINEALAMGPNFAGHYTVATWGCGSGCQEHAVVDAKTGNIISFGLTTEMGVKYYPNSRILITNPKESFLAVWESDMTPAEIVMTWSRIPREYYELTENNGSAYLQKVCTENPFENQL